MKDKGLIFNIQKFSVNDGPGIRTVIFFKGCPLRCKWCSNPESQSFKKQLFHDNKRCIKCLRCIKSCPKNAILFKDNNIIINHDLCDACERCIKVCENRALNVEGNYNTVDEVMNVVMQDIDFYLESGGGITLSGGELLWQKDFAIELLKESKKNGLHTCIETTAYTNEDVFKEIINYVDYLFIDIKHYDREKHFEGTGVYNDMIISNLNLALSMKKELIVRIPVIPKFNSSLDDAKKFAILFNELNVKKCQLLPFHQFGENKYHLLNKDYVYADVESLHTEDLKEYQDILIAGGIDAYF